jgi:hypothetical protein
LSIADSSRGARFSDNAVKSRTSENSTLIVRLSPSIVNRSPLARICLTRSGGTYSPNRSASARVSSASRRKPEIRLETRRSASIASAGAIAMTAFSRNQKNSATPTTAAAIAAIPTTLATGDATEARTRR